MSRSCRPFRIGRHRTFRPRSVLRYGCDRTQRPGPTAWRNFWVSARPIGAQLPAAGGSSVANVRAQPLTEGRRERYGWAPSPVPFEVEHNGLLVVTATPASCSSSRPCVDSEGRDDELSSILSGALLPPGRWPSFSPCRLLDGPTGSFLGALVRVRPCRCWLLYGLAHDCRRLLWRWNSTHQIPRILYLRNSVPIDSCGVQEESRVPQLPYTTRTSPSLCVHAHRGMPSHRLLSSSSSGARRFPGTGRCRNVEAVSLA